MRIVLVVRDQALRIASAVVRALDFADRVAVLNLEEDEETTVLAETAGAEVILHDGQTDAPSVAKALISSTEEEERTVIISLDEDWKLSDMARTIGLSRQGHDVFIAFKHRTMKALGGRGEVISTQGLGVGGAIEIGCKKALTRFGQNCVIVVMAGDGQMDPRDLETVIQPVLDGRSDHVKGNRWLHPDGPKGMPVVRQVGTWWLSRLTSLASGVRIRDSQCGYTATSGSMIADWDWSRTWQGYGYPNWWLMEAGRRGFRIEEVPVRSIYANETSGIKISRFLGSVSWMLWKGIWRRGIDWYILGKDTNPFLRVVATSLWFGGWFALLFSLQQPALLVAAPVAFMILAGLDNKESKRRRGYVSA